MNTLQEKVFKRISELAWKRLFEPVLWRVDEYQHMVYLFDAQLPDAVAIIDVRFGQHAAHGRIGYEIRWLTGDALVQYYRAYGSRDPGGAERPALVAPHHLKVSDALDALADAIGAIDVERFAKEMLAVRATARTGQQET